ncbi:unnamed protein product [Orchesella dallaii]|uniref:C2H2-type domain-containing protein n=1 Tax=Orchesella dallaii TaxID=48710 RepID=A0ABP1S890_9HEXA
MGEVVRREVKVEPPEAEDFEESGDDEEGVVVKEEPLEEYTTYVSIIVKDNENGDEGYEDDEELERDRPSRVAQRTAPSRRTRSSQHLFPPLSPPIGTSSEERPTFQKRNQHLKKKPDTLSSFFSKLDSKVRLVIREALALQKDPRAYHRFYHVINSCVQDGVKQGLVQEGEEVDQLWVKYDKFASSEFENANGQVPPDAEEILKNRTWAKPTRGKNMRKTLAYGSSRKKGRESVFKKHWSYAFELIIACDERGTTVKEDLGCRRKFYHTVKEICLRKQAFLNSVWTALLTLKKDEIQGFIEGGGGDGAVLPLAHVPHLPVELRNEVEVPSQLEAVKIDPGVSNEDNLEVKTYKTKLLKRLQKTFKRKVPVVKVSKKKLKAKPIKPIQTPEEIAFQRNMNNFLWRSARRARMSPEEWDKMNKKILARKRMLNAVLTPDKIQARLERHKKWRNNLTGDRKNRFRQSVYNSIKRCNQKLKETNPEKFKERYERLKSYQRERIANETPEQRQKRLLRYKQYQARRRARAEMEQDGVAPEEIQRRLEELKKELEEREANKPLETHQYKPRINGRKSKKLMELRSTQQQSAIAPVEEAIPPPPEVEPTPSPLPPSELYYQPSTHLNLDRNAPMYQDDGYDDHGDQDHNYDDDDDDYYEPPITQYEQNDGGANTSIDLKTEFISPFQASTSVPTFQASTSTPPFQASTSVPTFQASTSIPNVSDINPPTPPITATQNVKVLETEPLPSSSSTTSELPVPVKKKSGYDPTALIVCEECGKSVARQSMKAHKKNYHNPDETTYKCPKCDAAYKNSKGLWLHYNNFHEEENISASISSTSFIHKTTPSRVPTGLGSMNLKQQASRSRDIPSPCDQCGKQFKQRATLDDHIRRVHMGLGFFCEICAKEEQTGTKLWRHKKEKHGVDEPPPVQTVICEYCGEYVLRSYEQHVRRQHQDKYDEYLDAIGSVKKPSVANASPKLLMVKCPKCSKEIMHSSLKRHLKSVHKLAPNNFACQQCGTNFVEKFRLTDHVRSVHTLYFFEKKIEAMKLIKSIKDDPTKPVFICSICEKKIDCKIDMGGHLLANHYDIYEQMRKADASVWKCEECSATFSCESLFSSHLLQEHPHKIYFCGSLSCLKLFPDVESLTLHRKAQPYCSGYVEKRGNKKRIRKRWKKKVIVSDTEVSKMKEQKQALIKSEPKSNAEDSDDEMSWKNVKIDSDAGQRKSTRKRKSTTTTTTTSKKRVSRKRDAKLDKVVKIVVMRLTQAEILAYTIK